MKRLLTLMAAILPLTLAWSVSVDAAQSAPVMRTHVVERGQTLYSIARGYGVPLARIVALNGIVDPSRILAGTRLVVPGVTDHLATLLPSLLWPVDGTLVSRYGRPRRTHRHQGIDIGADRGTPIHAVADGVVSIASENRGDYGRLVTIEHGNDLTSYYGHNMRNLVVEGQWVAAGTVIALVGHTGNASGNHVHFELRYKGVPIDPMQVLDQPDLVRAERRTARGASPSAQR